MMPTKKDATKIVVTMASNGGGIGRFARRQADAPTKAPAPAPPVAANNNEQQAPSPNNDYGSFGGGSFDANVNVGMFEGGSFDFEADNKTSYDYNDFEGFGGMSDQPEENNVVPGSSDSAAAVAGIDPTQSTIPSQESLATTPVATNKTIAGAAAAGPFQFRASQGKAPRTSPPRPQTAAPQQAQSGFSLFASRKRAATSQEPSTVEKAPGQPLEPTGVATSTTAPPPPTNTRTVEDTTPNNNKTGSTFTRVLPPPSIAPSKPLQTQKGIIASSTTPKGPSNNMAGVFLPPLTEENEDFSTPMLPRTVDANSSIIQKTADSNMTTTFVTPESNIAANGGVSTLPDSALEDAFLGELDAGKDGFDDLLSLFLGDLRSATDLQLHGEAEILDLEVDLSRAFALKLHDRSDCMDLLDCIEDVQMEADGVIAVMQGF